MKNYTYHILKILGAFVLLTISNSCSDDDTTSFAFENVSAPSNLKALIEMTNPDGNEITVILSGENASTFDVFFGDVENEEATTANPGEVLTKVYEEKGEYILKAVAKTITGATSELSRNIIIGGTVVVDPPIIMGPQEPALSPSFTEANVISLFSDIYTDVTVDTWRTDWSNATFEDIDIMDNQVKKYSDLDFLGIETVANQIDASAMTHIHLDVWTDNVEEFKVKLVDFGQDGSFGGGDDTEHELVFDSLISAEWNDLDIALADFSGLNSRTNLAQYIFAATPSGSTTVYLDNIYFYKDTSVSSLPSLPVNMENSSVAYNWTGFGSPDFGEIPATVVNNPDTSGINTSAHVLEIQKLQGAQVWAGASLQLDAAINFSTSQIINIKVWSPKVGATILFKIEDVDSPPDNNGNPSVIAEVPMLTTTSNEWEELSFDMSTFPSFDSNAPYDRIVIFPDFNVMGEGENFYFDDIMLNE